MPGLDAVATIAAWWATGRDHPAPEPTSEAARQQQHAQAGGLDEALNGTHRSGATR